MSDGIKQLELFRTPELTQAVETGILKMLEAQCKRRAQDLRAGRRGRNRRRLQRHRDSDERRRCLMDRYYLIRHFPNNVQTHRDGIQSPPPLVRIRPFALR